MQEQFKNLDHQQRYDGGPLIYEKVLVGKLLSTLAEIISKTLRKPSKIQVENVEENVFKFMFGTWEEREKVFNKKSWFLSGSHLIMKELDAKKSIDKISLEKSTGC